MKREIRKHRLPYSNKLILMNTQLGICIHVRCCWRHA